MRPPCAQPHRCDTLASATSIEFDEKSLTGHKSSAIIFMASLVESVSVWQGVVREATPGCYNLDARGGELGWALEVGAFDEEDFGLEPGPWTASNHGIRFRILHFGV